MSRKSSGGNKSGTEFPWTASRCLRLLRPLTVHLNALKALATGTETVEQRGPTRAANGKKRPRYGNEEDAQDLAWNKCRQPKKLKRTYGSRQNATETRPHDEGRVLQVESAALPLGTISMPTPLLNRTIPSSPTHQQIETPSRKSATQMGPPGPPPAVFSNKKRAEVISHVASDLNHILDHTVVNPHREIKVNKRKSDADVVQHLQTLSSVGVPSLFSMCIRAVPAYIANEEAWAKEEDEDEEAETNVTTATYDLLEDLGQSEEGGWTHLRTVVQAHAVYAIRQVVEGGYISHIDELQGILQTLLHLGQGGQAREIMSSYILAQQSLATPALARKTLSHESKACFVPSGASGRANGGPDPHAIWSSMNHMHHGEQARKRNLTEQINTTQEMLRSGKLLAEWLSCPHLVPQWTQILQNLSRGRTSYFTAASFVHHYLRSACQLHALNTSQSHASVPAPSRSPALQEATLRTMISLLSTLVTFMVTERKHAKGVGIIRPIRLTVLDICLDDPEEIAALDVQAMIARMLVLVTDMLALQRSETFDADGTVDSHLTQIMALHNELSSREGFETSSYEQLAELICAICSSWSRATQGSGVPLLRDVVGRLFTCIDKNHDKSIKPMLRSKAGILRFLKRVGLEAVMLFETQHPSQEAAAYLHTVETLTSQSTRTQAIQPSDTNASSPATAGRPGFRWEQGISEWIASTPASLLQVKTLAIQEDPEATYQDVMKTPAVADSIKRWRTRPREVFVGVVIPPYNIPATSLWKSSNASPNPDIEYELKMHELKMPTTISPISFEDSGVFVASEDEKENQSAASGLSKEGLDDEQKHDDDSAPVMPLSVVPRTKSSPAQRQRLMRSHRVQLRAELFTKPRRITQRSKVITAPVSPSPSSQSSESRTAEPSHIARLAKGPRPVQLLQEDDSEDELSIHETDCGSGAHEVKPSRRGVQDRPLLGQATAAGSRPQRRVGRVLS